MTTTQSSDEDDVPLKTLVIWVCENCINRVPGECHVPGCFYIYRNIEEVPTYLEHYVRDDVPAVT